jgi:cation diffusion facilitator family transporter
VSPQRRTALVSVAAACALLALKLGAGVASGSLGLVSEALHSGTDLVAALLTFFAVGLSGRPADEQHQYGHGKAEHLAALFEAAVLALVSVGVAGLAVARLAGWIHIDVDAAWWAFLVIGLVLVSRERWSRSGPRGGSTARHCSRTRSTSAATSQGRWRC